MRLESAGASPVASAGPATPPRARSTRSSSTRRPGGRGRGSAPRRPGTRRGRRGTSSRSETRSRARGSSRGRSSRAPARRKTLKPPVRSATPSPSIVAGVGAAAAADQPPPRPPLGDPAAGDVARPEHQVGVGGRAEQPRQVGRVVREVGVHLGDQLGAAGQRPAEAGDVGGTEALLARAVQDLDVGGRAAASRSAISPVPSGEESSTTSSRRSAGSCSRIAAAIASRLAASL